MTVTIPHIARPQGSVLELLRSTPFGGAPENHQVVREDPEPRLAPLRERSSRRELRPEASLVPREHTLRVPAPMVSLLQRRVYPILVQLER